MYRFLYILSFVSIVYIICFFKHFFFWKIQRNAQLKSIFHPNWFECWLNLSFFLYFDSFFRVNLDTDDCEQCTRTLEELENIDDDCDRHGITFVKTKDFSVAEQYGVHDFPALVYFESNIPNVFEGISCSMYALIRISYKTTIIGMFSGQLDEEEEVLQWLITQKTEDRIELITRQMLETMVEDTQYLAVYFCKSINLGVLYSSVNMSFW